MNILVIGGGGREHALVWKIKQSPLVKKIYCAPGNAGIFPMAECVPISVDKISQLADFAKDKKIDLTIVGPEDPAANGIVDFFEKKNLKIFGPNKKAAKLEASKIFAKDLMVKYGIKTAASSAFTSYEKAKKYIEKIGAPIVVKADGLAAGKGVFVCKDKEEAFFALDQILKKKVFKEAGIKALIEEHLVGEEASYIAFTDGKSILPLPSSQDHKRIFDNDEGPNTGGMGAYSPAPIITNYLDKKIIKEVMQKTVDAMREEGCIFKGILYAGLMIDGEEIKVLEFNVRFGDPEAQPLLMRVKSDIVPIMMACINGTLDKYSIELEDKASVCVVMASGGYPGAYKKGLPIKGLDKAKSKDSFVFHAGTSFNDKKEIVASGGRVLGVTALGDDVKMAIDNAYALVKKISWQDCQYRTDIGQKAFKWFNKQALVSIIMGSKSDANIMEGATDILEKFKIAYELKVLSAHRNHDKLYDYIKESEKKGVKVFIAGAGYAAHLAGNIAALTTKPVIGIPIDSSSLNGLDSLLSTVQMPGGVPVATVTIGKAGAKNAAILAAQILSVYDEKIEDILKKYKDEIAK